MYEEKKYTKGKLLKKKFREFAGYRIEYKKCLRRRDYTGVTKTSDSQKKILKKSKLITVLAKSLL